MRDVIVGVLLLLLMLLLLSSALFVFRVKRDFLVDFCIAVVIFVVFDSSLQT